MTNVERKQGKVIGSGLTQVSVARGTIVVEMEKTEMKPLTLEQAVEEYKNNPTPESMNRFNQAFWAEACKVEGEGRQIDILNLPKTVEVSAKVIAPFDPQEVSLVDFEKMFPKMNSWTTQIQEGGEIVDKVNNSGYFSASMDVDAPYLNTTEEGWVKKLEQEGLQPMSLKHYIIFGQMMKLLTGKYPDQGLTWSRLGSSCDGGVLVSDFKSDGVLYVALSKLPEDHSERFGGRGERRIKAV